MAKTLYVWDIVSMTEEVEKDRNKLFIGQTVKWLNVSSLSAQLEGTESQTSIVTVFCLSRL